MSIAVDVAAEDMRMPLPRDRVVAIARSALIAEGVRDALVSVTFLGRRRIAALNRTHLGHRGATDVISFGFTRASKRDPVIGDVYICPDVARANAASRRIPVREELTRLVVHGVLHVLGHDHPEGDEREKSPMWRRQEALVRRLRRRAS
jgi:probable rRNA maturation factor